MAAGEEFTRAKCDATGAIAALPKLALEYGHIPGWRAVDGPLPNEPKSAIFDVPPEEPDSVPTETKPSAGGKSANTKEV